MPYVTSADRLGAVLFQIGLHHRPEKADSLGLFVESVSVNNDAPVPRVEHAHQPIPVLRGRSESPHSVDK